MERNYDRHRSLVCQYNSRRRTMKDKCSKTGVTRIFRGRNELVKDLSATPCCPTLETEIENHGKKVGFLPAIDTVDKPHLKERQRPASARTIEASETKSSFPYLRQQNSHHNKIQLHLKAVVLNGSMTLLEERKYIQMALVGRGDHSTEYLEELPLRVNVGYEDEILWNKNKRKRKKHQKSVILENVSLPRISVSRVSITERKKSEDNALRM